jgi:hypothetical protein
MPQENNVVYRSNAAFQLTAEEIWLENLSHVSIQVFLHTALTPQSPAANTRPTYFDNQ